MPGCTGVEDSQARAEGSAKVGRELGSAETVCTGRDAVDSTGEDATTVVFLDNAASAEF